MDLFLLYGVILFRGGYTYKIKNQWFKVDIRAVLIPYWLWGIVGILFALAKAFATHELGQIDIVTKVYRMVTGIASDNYPLWFLVAYFVTKTAYDAINRLLQCKLPAWMQRHRNWMEFILVMLLAVIGYAYIIIKTPGHSVLRFDTGLIMLPFFMIGRRLPILIDYIIQHKLCYLALIIALLINLISGMCMNTLVSVCSNEYGNILMFYISSIFGSILAFICCILFTQIVPITKLLSYLGRYSLIILCSHCFVLFGLSLLLIHLHLPQIPIVTTAICIAILLPIIPILNNLTKRVQDLLIKY